MMWRRHKDGVERRRKRRVPFLVLSLVAIAALGACALFVSQRPTGPSAPLSDEANVLTAPLVFDLDGDGIELMNSSGAYFDMDLDGFAERTGWVSRDDGMLALDRNENGTIDDITELLGTGGKWRTVDLHRALAAGNLTTGFNLLREWDDDANGVFDAADPMFERLRVWRDLNGDGISQTEELQGLTAAGVAFLAITSTQGIVEDGKNAITDSGEYSRVDGSKSSLVSVRFQYRAGATKYLGPVTIDPATANLPKLDGAGEAKSLSAAMTEDPRLRELVTDFTKLTVADAPALEARTAEILFRWYRAEEIEPTSRGPNIDGRVMTALERMHGTPWRSPAGSPKPHLKASALLMEAWREDVAHRMVVLLAQVPLGQELFPGLAYKARAFIVLPNDLLLEKALENLRRHAPSDPALKLRYWRSMILALDVLYSEFKETVAKEARGQFKDRFVAAIDAALAAESVPYSYGEIRIGMFKDSGEFVLPKETFTFPQEQ